MDNAIKEKSNLMKAGLVLVVILAVYFAVRVVTEMKNYRFIGGGAPASNIISFNGEGEVTAVPDIATISFTLSDSQKDLKTAQDKVTEKETAVLAFLEAQSIDKKDIKTESYSSYPKYDYGAPCYGNYTSMGMPCRPSEPTITGYTVSEYISVKVRDIAKAGEVVKGVGAIGVNDMSGPNFTIDKEDELKAEARKMAIEDARAKAKTLSKDLGVRLVRIVSFSEDGAYPMMYGAYDMMKAESAMGGAVSNPAPTLPTGENKITSNVTITYEIR